MSPGVMVDLGAPKTASSGKPPVKGGVKILNKADLKVPSNGGTSGGGVKLLSKGKAQPPSQQNSEAVEKAAAELKRLNIVAPTFPPGTSNDEKAKELLRRLSTTADEAQLRSAAAGVGQLAKEGGPLALEAHGLASSLGDAIGDAAPASLKQGALYALGAIAREGSRACEPIIVGLLPAVLNRHADKVAEVRQAAEEAREAISGAVSPHALPLLLPLLWEAMDNKKLWQTKLAAVSMLRVLTRRASSQVTAALPDIIPPLSERMCDAKQQVQEAASKAMTECCALVGNRDIEPVVPALMSCMARPTETSDCITKVSCTTFVQPVEAPTLAVLTPLLVRGLRVKSTPIIRKTAIIINNMSKLVFSASDAVVFFPRLLPGLEKAAAETANPECRSVVEMALGTLSRAATPEAVAEAARPSISLQEAESLLRETWAATCPSSPPTKAAERSIRHAAAVCASLSVAKTFDLPAWTKEVLGPYLEPFIGQEGVETLAHEYMVRCRRVVRHEQPVQVEETDEEELCNCDFSLAYGGKVLLHNANMRLIRGRRYGLCGPNGVGKTTLLKAIAEGKVDGFPPKDVLRTVYTEHEIKQELAELSVVDYVFADEVLKATSGPSREVIMETLTSVGFTQALQERPISSLSGGWRMKLAIARAMLLKADILLLDEPTNHLDSSNVAWLENYLCSLSHVTSLIVSHDSGFLDTVCTDIIDYNKQKLTVYKGNLSEFVKVKPEAKSYYELAAASLKFIFPKPGILVGVSSKDREIVNMKGVCFRYPGRDTDQLQNVKISACLASRVAVLGVNGAGKSTLIKLLTGELEPTAGTIWRHPNLRIAYIAQHAFHHVEKHLDVSPLQYIQWRFAHGEDREGLEKVTRKITEEERQQMLKFIPANGGQHQVKELVGRRKLKNSYEYEVAWVDMREKYNTWMSREKLIELGFAKLVNEVDVKQATREGLMSIDAKEFSTTSIQKHLEDFGLDAEFSTHSAIRGLSGGQKVKVVLAAAMWNNPHLLVLDEPTNFLDRESLGALASAIQEFAGGVIMISHNSEFTEALCSETWTVADGAVTVVSNRRREKKDKGTVSVFLKYSGSSSNMTRCSSRSSLGGGSDSPGMSRESSAVNLAENGAGGGRPEGEELTQAILEASRLKQEKLERARQKKEEKELQKKLRASRKY